MPKRTARARAGALATNARLFERHSLRSSAQCLCCSTLVDDDADVVAGCSGTGSADCAKFVSALCHATLRKPSCCVITPRPCRSASHPQPMRQVAGQTTVSRHFNENKNEAIKKWGCTPAFGSQRPQIEHAHKQTNCHSASPPTADETDGW